jgi:hypothetical protein
VKKKHPQRAGDYRIVLKGMQIKFMFKKLQVSLIRKFARKRLGKDIAPLGTIATHPDVLIPYTKFSMALDKTNLVPAKLKVLGQIRAAKLVECPF